MRSDTVKRIARECGFELAGVAAAEPPADFARFEQWVERGYAGEMRYLTDRRAELRRDPRSLLASARSIICVGKLYNTSHEEPAGTTEPGAGGGAGSSERSAGRAGPVPAPEITGAPISRYAWGSRDYHDVLRDGLERMAERLRAIEPHEWKICVDTAPLLERTYARLAGLGWIGKNTCLIHEPSAGTGPARPTQRSGDPAPPPAPGSVVPASHEGGSWYFLGEILTSLELEPDSPPPDRCGTCTRCIDACPTQAIVPDGDSWTLDSRRCISYLTIELRGPIPEDLRTGMGQHVFGCDICQDVCPWNSRAPVTSESAFTRRELPSLDAMARMTEDEFREFSRGTPLARPKYAGFRRNAEIAANNRNPPREVG